MHDFSEDKEALQAVSDPGEATPEPPFEPAGADAAAPRENAKTPSGAEAPEAPDTRSEDRRNRREQPRQAGVPEIPWRGMPSLPALEPPAVGVLLGAYDAETGAGVGGGLEGELPRPCTRSCPKDEQLNAEMDEAFKTAFGKGETYGADYQCEAELVLGVKLSQYGPVYLFKAGQEKLKPGAQVLVETEQGLALGEVLTARRLRLPLPKIRTDEGNEVEIKPIRGLAGPEDIAAAADNRILASSARLFCKECIRERGLEMKLVDVEVLHDRSKIIFYFTAPSRIDFRELVKCLVRNYHTRIELRQIGVRHETQMIGAVGNCGMTCCCRRYLRKFAPVTIKMAKEQNLFLNPAKLSGICGRLLCCLAYEQDNYEEFHKRSPKIGKKYNTDKGVMRVLRANLFRQSIFVLDENNEESELQLDEWEALQPARQDQNEGYGQGSYAQRDGRRAASEDRHASGRGERGERRPDSRPDSRPDRRPPHRPEQASERPGDRPEIRPEVRSGDPERGNRRERGQSAEGREPREKSRNRQPKNEGLAVASQQPLDDVAIPIGGDLPGQTSESRPENADPGRDFAETPLQAEPGGNSAGLAVQEGEAGPDLLTEAAEEGSEPPAGTSTETADDDRSIFGLPGSRYLQDERRPKGRGPRGQRPRNGKNRGL